MTAAVRSRTAMSTAAATATATGTARRRVTVARCRIGARRRRVRSGRRRVARPRRGVAAAWRRIRARRWRVRTIIVRVRWAVAVVGRGSRPGTRGVVHRTIRAGARPGRTIRAVEVHRLRCIVLWGVGAPKTLRSAAAVAGIALRFPTAPAGGAARAIIIRAIDGGWPVLRKLVLPCRHRCTIRRRGIIRRCRTVSRLRSGGEVVCRTAGREYGGRHGANRRV